MKNIWDKKCWVVKYSLLGQQLYCKCEGREKENDFFQSPFLYSPRNERTLARSFYLGLVCFLNAFPLSPLPNEQRTNDQSRRQRSSQAVKYATIKCLPLGPLLLPIPNNNSNKRSSAEKEFLPNYTGNLQTPPNLLKSSSVPDVWILLLLLLLLCWSRYLSVHNNIYVSQRTNVMIFFNLCCVPTTQFTIRITYAQCRQSLSSTVHCTSPQRTRRNILSECSAL